MVLIQLLLPTSQDPESPEFAAAVTQTRRELADRFSGLTAYLRAPATGLWTSPDGHKEQDDVVMIELVTDAFDRQWWRTYSATLAERFRQDTIHVRALSVEMLD